MTRPWTKTSESEWTCQFEGRAEIVRYVPGKRHCIEYLVAGRRRTEHCSEWDTEREARLALERAVAALTVSRTQPRQAGRHRKQTPQDTELDALPIPQLLIFQADIDPFPIYSAHA